MARSEVNVTTKEKPKPCPFCGGKAEWKIHTIDKFGTPYDFLCRIRCSRCGAEIRTWYRPARNVANQVQAAKDLIFREWNRRVDNG